MKKTITILVLLITCMSAMAQDSTEPLETIYQKFAFTLFNKVAEDGNKNVILSPFSAERGGGQHPRRDSGGYGHYGIYQ